MADQNQAEISILADHRQLLADRNKQPNVGNMTDQTREEVDAKIGAAEARGDTKIARMEGKLDLVLSKIDGVRSELTDVRADNRSTRANQWLIGLGLAGLILAVAFGLPQIIDFGARFRDVVHSEVQSAMPAPSK